MARKNRERAESVISKAMYKVLLNVTRFVT